MRKITVVALVLCGLTAACSVRSERTVVEHPQPAPAAVVATPPPSTTVVVPSN
ncbi:hypothetical protein [Reyranella sp.]|jgi:hypothetical protein|uniref:hypothetical protein n=1 Tax=Reyranella sp. TaxID=1929291 RepID=UPI002F935D6E